MRKNLPILLLIFVAVLNVRAQGDTTFFSRVDLLLQLFDETNYKPIRFGDTSLQVIENISHLKRNDSYADRSLYLQKQLELYERDYGLAVTGNFLQNFDPSISDLEDNLTYTRRVQAGLEWNILSGGFFENKVKARIFEDRIIREQMMNEATEESFHFLQRFDQTIYVFNVVKIELLLQRKQQLEEQYTVINELVLLKKLKKEELINIESRLAEVESLINVYKSYNDYLGLEADTISFELTNLPLIDLNYDRIFAMIGSQTDSMLATRVYNDYYSWYHAISLRTFARYNFYELIDDNNRSFFSAGLTFSIPIPFNTKLKNEVENERWKYENEKLVQNRVNLHEDVLNTGYEFRYKLKQFIGFIQKRKVFAERLRIEKVKIRMNDNNIDPLAGLELYDDLVRIDIELVDLLQNMYLKALKVHSKIPHSSIRDVVKNQTLEDINEYLDKKERSVYVWSKTFEEYSPEFLAEYVIYNEFEKIVVAVQKIDTLAGKKVFMEYAEQNGDIYFMLGNNLLMFESDIHGYLDGVLTSYQPLVPKGIHLDIEPHTFDNWGAEKQTLLNQYLEFVGKVSTWCEAHDMELDVSIPPHYNKEVIDKLLVLSDHIYFMCYENVKTEYIVGKLTPFIDNAKEKLVIALRTEDFVNRIELEDKIKELEKLTGIDKFAYHDLRRIIAFDRKSIEY